MRPPAPRRLARVAAWLLTPVIAWAVSFLGAWTGAAIGHRVGGGTAALGWLVAGGVVGAVGGVVAWVWVMRRVRRPGPPGDRADGAAG